MHQLARMGVAGASGKGIRAVASPYGSFACIALGQVAGLATWHHLVQVTSTAAGIALSCWAAAWRD
jgi:hypothetical protein